MCDHPPATDALDKQSKFMNSLSLIITSVLTIFVSNVYFAELAFSATDAPDFHKLEKYARFADASYENRAEIQALSKETGYEVSAVDLVNTTNVQYVIASQQKDNTQLLVFRGTANVENAVLDLDFKLTPNADLGIKIHNGFGQAAKLLYEKLKPQLDKTRKITLVGHSLGGALAVVVAMYLQQDGYLVDAVVTFGQPKVTNLMGARKFSNLPVTRVVTDDDIVPLVPPIDPMDLANLDIYWHIGQEIVLLQGEYYARLEGLAAMLRGVTLVGKSINGTAVAQDNVRAHLMQTYVQLIAAKITRSQLVPYDKRESYPAAPPATKSPAST